MHNKSKRLTPIALVVACLAAPAAWAQDAAVAPPADAPAATAFPTLKDGAKWEDALQQKVGATPEQLTVALGETLRIRGLGSTANAQLDPRKVQGGPEHDPQGQNEDNANSRNRNRQQ